jgi:hypothetical protein
MGFINKVIGEFTGANAAAKAANNAANTQSAAAQQAIDQQNAQYAKYQQLAQPYVQAGNNALGAYQNLAGLNGNDAQSNAINGIQNSSQFQSLNQQGFNAIDQNASATGGLRGGNTQAALAQFSPNLLNSLIQQQYSNLGGLASMGQNAVAGVGSSGANNANSVGSLLQQQGAARAGGQIAQGQAAGSAFGALTNIGGALLGSGALGGLFGGAGASTAALGPSFTGGSVNGMGTFALNAPTLPTSSLIGKVF